MKRKNDTAVFTVIFPANAQFFEDFIKSLNQQTVSTFDLVIMNDGVLPIPAGFKDFHTLVFPSENTQAKTRETGLKKLLELEYKYIIFADSDDMMSNNRVEVSLNMLERYDLVANDLDLIDEKGDLILSGYWKNRLPDETRISADFLLDKNIFGLSNTAVTGKILNPIHIPESLTVIDWYIFLHLITEKSKAVFTHQTSTKYRRHTHNIGSAGKVTRKSLWKALEVKYIYYKLLSKESEQFKRRYEKVRELKEKFKEERYIEEYLETTTQKIENPFWWEEIS